MIASADGTQRLLLIEVPDDKQVKNRVHLDLKPAEGVTRDVELARLLALGAREGALRSDHRDPDGADACRPSPSCSRPSDTIGEWARSRRSSWKGCVAG